MELFRLMGSIFVNSDEADASLQSTDAKAEKVGGTFMSSIGKAVKFGAGVATAMGVAGLAVVGLSLNVGEKLQKALNGLQAETGSTDEAMKGLRESMLNIYNNNFGDSFEDIGIQMALVAKSTGLTGKELENATTNALLMRDTFGFEVADSIKGTSQMMNQFGLTSEQSFNLLANGAQNGLNKSDDLLDTLNEYSGTFKAQGFSAEEMFNMLSNASKSGIRDVDLAADAIKEFGIRSKDASTTSVDGFKSLGLNAIEMTKAFGLGGEVGKKAFGDVTAKLVAMKDPVEQNRIGVELFGTQFEDLGVKGITALVNTNGAISNTKDALGKINAVKYNTMGEAFEGIKRNLETSILIPISDKILPALSQFSNWIIEHMPEIKNEISYAMTVIGKAFDDGKIAIDGVSTAIGVVIDWCKKYQEILIPLGAGIGAGAIAFGIYTLAMSAGAIATGVWATITGIATTVGTAFGVVMAFLTSPIGLIILAIGLLVIAGVALYRNWDTVKTKAMSIFGAIGDFIGGIVDGIKSGFKGMVNGVISGLNTMIRGLNGLKFSLPDWIPILGGKSFGLSIPQIPSFAVGSRYLPNDMLAQLHKGEMIVPKSENPYANSGGGTLPSNSLVINFNGSYSFADKKDIDYFMNESAKLVHRRKG